jgi:hypothetical protein
MTVRRFLVCALTMLCAATASAQSRGGGPARPVPPPPRWPDGIINLGDGRLQRECRARAVGAVAHRSTSYDRVTRVDFNTLKYELTIDDPGAYTGPWTSGYTKEWNPNQETFEYVCQENNFTPRNSSLP